MTCVGSEGVLDYWHAIVVGAGKPVQVKITPIDGDFADYTIEDIIESKYYVEVVLTANDASGRSVVLRFERTVVT